MNAILVYSTHGYTIAVVNRLKKMGVQFWVASSEADFTELFRTKTISLVILDSSSEREISRLLSRLDAIENNRHASVLFLVPGAIHYEEKLFTNERAVLGISKPFSVKQFENTARFLIEKKQQQDKVISSLKDMQHFAVMASHDLKTPIKNVFAYSEIALEELAEVADTVPEEVFEYVEIVRDESKRMITFVNDMFEFSSAGNVSLKPEPIALETFCREVFEMVAKSFEGREAQLTLEDIPGSFVGDKAKLSHIFQNLFENAFKYSADDQPLQLMLRASPYGATGKLFCVEDNGHGIRNEDIAKIFLPFKRGLTNVRGTGIGLSIVKKFVEAHHGEIWVESSLGHGSKFFFSCAELVGDRPHVRAS